jgi:putative ABC transport system substrate-binding protein
MKNVSSIFLIITITLVVVCGTAHAQQPRKIPRIGYLAGDSQAPSHAAFRQGLRDLGYVEGQTLLIEWRFAEDKPFPSLPPSWFASKLT